MKNIFTAVLKKFDGWKTIIAYILVQIPWVSENPILADAITKLLANPKDTEAWTNLVVQLLLLVGVADILRKNITQGTARKFA